MPDNTQIFILHHTPAIERKKSLLSDFNSIKITYPIVWVEKYLPDQLKNIQCKININELSITLKHKEVLNTLVNTKNLNYAIILEDDVDIFSVADFNNFLEQSLHEIKKNNGDILWLGSIKKWNIYHLPNNTLLNKQEKCTSYFNEECLSRCAHAYIISKKAAQKALERYHYDLPADHLFNEIIQHKKLKSGWTEPFLTQKSIDGTWSTIR